VTDKVMIEEVNLVLECDRAAVYGVDRAPAIVLLAGDEKADSRIRVLGAPAGYDFMSLVDAILVVSDASPQRLSAETEQKLAALTEPITVQVFVTPT
jgi:alkyl hydroperoxide reductase subunit AhpF